MNENRIIQTDLTVLFQELEKRLQEVRAARGDASLTIKDLRREFDQQSAKMNQAIFNDQHDQIRETCTKSILPLLEILCRI